MIIAIHLNTFFSEFFTLLDVVICQTAIIVTSVLLLPKELWTLLNSRLFFALPSSSLFLPPNYGLIQSKQRKKEIVYINCS